MSRLIRIHDFDAYETFVWTLRRSREPIERAYLAAWAASDEANDLMRRQHFVSAETGNTFLARARIPVIDAEPADTIADLRRRAQVEDLHCDTQSTMVVHFADDLLQAFGRGVLGRAIGYDGYGKTYNNGVQLTTMLRAVTANVRHVSEWEDLPFPYEQPDKVKNGSKQRQALENIEILQGVFGIGKHQRIRDVSSWRALTLIDGLYGTHPPDYQRIEDAIIDAAVDIAKHGPPEAIHRLKEELARHKAAT